MSEKDALDIVRKRRFCAYWLIPKAVLRSLLKKGLVVPSGFYSVCLPKDKATFPVAIYDSEPEKSFDDVEW